MLHLSNNCPHYGLTEFDYMAHKSFASFLPNTFERHGTLTSFGGLTSNPLGVLSILCHVCLTRVSIHIWDGLTNFGFTFSAPFLGSFGEHNDLVFNQDKWRIQKKCIKYYGDHVELWQTWLTENNSNTLGSFFYSLAKHLDTFDSVWYIQRIFAHRNDLFIQWMARGPILARAT